MVGNLIVTRVCGGIGLAMETGCGRPASTSVVMEGEEGTDSRFRFFVSWSLTGVLLLRGSGIKVTPSRY